MADIIDFPIPKRPKILTWQCACGSFAFRLLSDRSAVCIECGFEAVRQFGFWEIKEPSPNAWTASVIPLRLFRETPEDKQREEALLAAALQSPLFRRIYEQGGAIGAVGFKPFRYVTYTD